jgi:hypothetical protein
MNRRLWLSRRGRLSAEPSFICPVCQEPSGDPETAALGYCAGCKDFTGLCAVGRFLRRPDAFYAVTCTDRGEIQRQISLRGGGEVRVLLCITHAAEAEYGSWVRVGASMPPEFQWPR